MDSIRELEYHKHDTLGVFAFEIYRKLFKLILDNPGKFKSTKEIYDIARKEKWICPDGSQFKSGDIVEILAHRYDCELGYIVKKNGGWHPTQDGIDAFEIYKIKNDMWVE